MARKRTNERIKPAALYAGDTVGIVAPASHFKREDFEAGCEALRKLGYNPVHSDSIFERDLYFAGTVERRARELEEMFARDDVKAVLCARGGYGANHLLPRLNPKLLAAKPKILVGYSDLTSLLTYIYDSAGLVTFHGPMVAKDFNREGGIDLQSWQSAVEGKANWELEFGSASAVQPLSGGSAEGVLYGGCLSMLVASLGTPYEIQTEGTILFMEDVATKPYQIDRMLMQLKLAGKFQGVKGIIFGEMLDCVQASNQEYSLAEIVTRVVGDLGIPIAYGLRSGHVSGQNMTLPIGVRAALEVSENRVSLKIVEAATTNRLEDGARTIVDVSERPLKPLHSKAALVSHKLKVFETFSNADLTKSLLPGEPGSLKVWPDGTMLDGHHRISVLRARGVAVDELPREIIAKEQV